MLLLEAELHIWRFARNKAFFRNAVNSYSQRSGKMLSSLDANLKLLKSIRSELNAKIEQIEAEKNNDRHTNV
jgi:hypothetical protein